MELEPLVELAYHLLILTQFICMAGYVMLIFQLHRKRDRYQAPAFLWLLVCLWGWLSVNLLEMLSANQEMSFFLFRLENTISALTSVAWLVCVLQYSNQARWLSARRIALALVIPLITIALVWSSHLHPFLWQEIQFIHTGNLYTFKPQPGIWFRVQWVYATGLFFLSLFALLPRLWALGKRNVSPLILVLLVFLLPPMFQTGYVLGIEPFHRVNLAPLTMGLSVLLATWYIYRRQAYILSPLASEAIFEHLRSGIIVLDNNNHIMKMNPAAMEIFECSGQSVLGVSFFQILPFCQDDFKQVLDNRDSNSELRLPNGSVIELRISPLFDHNGDFAGKLLLLLNITRRAQAEETLQKSERIFRNFIEQSSDGIILADETGRIVSCNKGEEQITGIPASAVIGELLSEWVEKVFTGENKTLKWMEHIRSHKPRLLSQPGLDATFSERELLWPNGAKRTIQESFFPIQTGHGIMLGLIHRDISDVRQAQSEMLSAYKLKSIETLVAGLAHEVNSPLQVLATISESMMRKIRTGNLPASSLQEDIEIMHRNIWRISEVINLLFTHTHSAPQKIECHNLNEIARQTVEWMGQQFLLESAIQIETNFDNNLPDIYCDCAQITQALVNLLNNAHEAMPEGGKIGIETQYDEPHHFVLLRVKDTGVGISQEILPRIFDPFFTTRPMGHGTGLGLSVTQSIIRSHGGEIDVDSAPGMGTTFNILLPLKPPSLILGYSSLQGRFDER